MKDHVADAVDEIVWRFGLHDRPLETVPVDRLESLFPIVRKNLDSVGIVGMVILPKHLPVSDANFARVVMSDALDDDQERIVYAHEVAHGIIGHEGELRLEDMASWFSQRAEHEAWEVAARLLIPTEGILEYGDVHRIAMVYGVPEWLVTMV